jgi:hypothetical protein
LIDVIVFFLLGVLARLVNSDLRLPEALSVAVMEAQGLVAGILLARAAPARQPVCALAGASCCTTWSSARACCCCWAG